MVKKRVMNPMGITMHTNPLKMLPGGQIELAVRSGNIGTPFVAVSCRTGGWRKVNIVCYVSSLEIAFSKFYCSFSETRPNN